MIGLKNCVYSAPKRLYDSGAGFVKNHPILTLSTIALTSTAALAYFSSDFSAFIRNLPQPPLSVSSFSKPELKTDSDKGTFFNKITTKIEYDQIETPTPYGQVVNYIKTGTFAAVKTTPQTHSLSEKYEFSILGNLLLYYPIYSTTCTMSALIFHNAIGNPKECRFGQNKLHCIRDQAIGAILASFTLDQLRQKFLGV